MTDGDPVRRDGSADPMRVEFRFFATFRAAVGQKSIRRELAADARVGDALAEIEAEFPELAGDVLDGDGDIRAHLTVLKNGREVVHLDGTATTLADGDTLSVFPPVAGG